MIIIGLSPRPPFVYIAFSTETWTGCGKSCALESNFLYFVPTLKGTTIQIGTYINLKDIPVVNCVGQEGNHLAEVICVSAKCTSFSSSSFSCLLRRIHYKGTVRLERRSNVLRSKNYSGLEEEFEGH